MISMNKSDFSNLSCADGKSIHQSHKADQEKSIYSYMGDKIPRNLSGSVAYWYSCHLDLYCMTEFKGTNPKYFVTYTQNDRWPELQRLVKNGVRNEFLQTNANNWFETEFAQKPHLKELFEDTEFTSIANYPVEAAKAFEKRFKMLHKIIIDPKGGPLGKITDFWWRREYQSRGTVHIHAVYWDDDKTTPPTDDVVAFLPPFDPIKDKDDPVKMVMNKAVKQYMIHDCSKGKCVNKITNQCKYGYPFKPDKYCSVNEIKRKKNNPYYYHYQRFSMDDANVIPYNLKLLLLWHGHINCLKLTNNGWISYLSKYVSKPEPSSKTLLYDRINEVERYFTTRIISSMEVADRLLDHALCQSSINIKHFQSNLANFKNLLKTKFDLDNMEDDSKDVFYVSTLDTYLNRPEDLLNIKYIEFFSTYVRDFKNCDKNEFKFRKLTKNIVIRVNYYDKNCEEESEAYYSQIVLCNLILTKQNFNNNFKYIFSDLNVMQTFKEECELLKFKDEDSPSFKFANNFLNSRKTDQLTTENGEFNEFLPAEEGTQRHIINSQELTRGDLDDLITVDDLPEEEEINNLSNNEEVNYNDLDEDLVVMEEIKNNYRDHYINSLNHFTNSQNFSFNYIINKWEIKKEPAQLIIQGAAGTGKSYLIDSLRGYLIDKNINHAVIAYSGSAASLICGNTIHSFFNITADDQMNFKVQANSETWNKIKHIEVFLVDEFTMIENLIFNGIDSLLSVMHPNSSVRRFGGKSMIFTGDVAQTTAINMNIFDNIIFKEQLEVLTLHECMRQLITAEPIKIPNDHGMTDSQLDEFILMTTENEENQQRKFYTALTHIRTNSVTVVDEELLYSAVLNTQFSLDQIDDIDKVTILTSLKHQRILYNEMCLNKINPTTPIKEYVAIDSGEPNKKSVNTTNERANDKISKKDTNLPNIIKLKPRCKIILLKNYNVLRGWVNGTFCTVLKLENDKILVKKYFPPRCNRKSHIFKWIRPTKVKLKTNDGKKYFRTQFPLELAYAITIHKSQGHTLEDVYIDLASTFAHGQAYVAISRVKRLKNLHFIGWDRRMFHLQDEKLITVMNILNSRSIN